MSFWTVVAAVMVADVVKTLVLGLIDLAAEKAGWRPE